MKLVTTIAKIQGSGLLLISSGMLSNVSRNRSFRSTVVGFIIGSLTDVPYDKKLLTARKTNALQMRMPSKTKYASTLSERIQWHHHSNEIIAKIKLLGIANS